MKERKSLAEQQVMKQTTQQKNNTTNNNSFSFGVSPVSSQKKPSAKERIGYLGPR